MALLCIPALHQTGPALQHDLLWRLGLHAPPCCMTEPPISPSCGSLSSLAASKYLGCGSMLLLKPLSRFSLLQINVFRIILVHRGCRQISCAKVCAWAVYPFFRPDAEVAECRRNARQELDKMLLRLQAAGSSTPSYAKWMLTYILPCRCGMM